ncbi:Imm39 family immunity protein [Solimonas sp. SE-A11]|uniref:Imm39 family immunity protein n=1 Tax=Solimonas sp. SE-A11 TaxID=3054954 RepID=UPI00259C8372|nr:Imm39 family immunity protein [Solimonas sp. SE-A11]MDM4769431.1 Imm39 family immunity protein [Solimonas sp. SE-A11]
MSIEEKRRQLLVGGSSTQRGMAPRNVGQATLRARNNIEAELEKHNFLGSAPFKTVSLIMRYVDVENLNPEGWDINKKHSTLNLAVSLDGPRLKSMTEEELELALRLAMIEVLCDVAANYDLPYEFLDRMRASS